MPSIKLNKQNKTVKIVYRTDKVKLSRPEQEISLKRSGATGPKGADGDKTYSQSFTALSTVHVQHNLGKWPSVTIRDSAGDEVRGGVHFIDNDSLELNFSAEFSGTVTCN
jgi:hypothetical protein